MYSLPPKVGDVVNGSVTWERVEGVNYELLGYFLSCHLVIEHYMDEYLKASYPELCWADTKHTFGQKIALLSRYKVSERFDFMPAVKHMNSLRNKLGHRIAYPIKMEELLPLSQFLTKASHGVEQTFADAHSLLRTFTSMVCVVFAGAISAMASRGRESQEASLQLLRDATDFPKQPSQL